MLICRVSHSSELIFVLTPQQDFHSILRHCKWVCTHLLLSYTHSDVLTPQLRGMRRIDDGVCTSWPALWASATSPSSFLWPSGIWKKKSITNLPWNEIVALKNVYGFVHFVQRKVLEMYSHIRESHLKQKVESELGIYVKVLLNFVMFPLCGMCCRCC